MKISEIAEGAVVPLPGTGYFAVRLGGEVYVYKDECPHAFCQFSVAGHLEGEDLVCTCHWAKFDVRTGRSLVPELVAMPLTPAKFRLEGDEVVVEECLA